MRKQPGASSRATLTQVAKMAGVSVTTASMVLAGKADENRISEETLLRVKQAAAVLDYSPNLLVKSLQRGRTNILSFFSAFRNREDYDLYMDRLSSALERVVGQHGLNLLVYCDFGISPEDTYQFLNGGHSDGLLRFAPRPDDPLLPMVRASRQPTMGVAVAASVQVDFGLLADTAVHILDRYIRGYDGDVVERTIPVTLARGTTLGPPGN